LERRIIDTITRWTAGIVLPLVVIAFLTGGLERASGAAAGAALVMINWGVLRWVAMGLLRRGDRRPLALTSVLIAKMGFVLAGAAVLVRVFDATGLLIGVSALVLGMFGGALLAHLTAPASEALAAGELAPSERD
jgi:hypothetical protein